MPKTRSQVWIWRLLSLTGADELVCVAGTPIMNVTDTIDPLVSRQKIPELLKSIREGQFSYTDRAPAISVGVPLEVRDLLPGSTKGWESFEQVFSRYDRVYTERHLLETKRSNQCTMFLHGHTSCGDLLVRFRPQECNESLRFEFTLLGCTEGIQGNQAGERFRNRMGFGVHPGSEKQ